MWTTTAISHIFKTKYHLLIISLFPGMLYIRETRFVKNNLSFGNCLSFEVWSPFTTWKHGKTSHLKLLVNIYSWTSEVEVLWLNLPLRLIGAVCHILAMHTRTWCLAMQVILTLLPTIHKSKPHWPHDPNRTSQPVITPFKQSSSLIIWRVYVQSTGSCKGFTSLIFHIHHC